MIDNLNKFYDTITAVVNTAVERGASKTLSGKYTVTYRDIADLISADDFMRYYPVIAGELKNREEILNMNGNSSVGELDIMIHPDYCPNYVALPGENYHPGSKSIKQQPSLSEQLNNAHDRTLQIPSGYIQLSCYADQVLPKTDNITLADDYYGAQFTVPIVWAEKQAKAAGFKDLEDFLDTYTWDHTDGWYEKAFEDKVLHSVSLGDLVHGYEPVYVQQGGADTHFQQNVAIDTLHKVTQISLDEKLSKATNTAQTNQQSQIGILNLPERC